MARAVRPEVVKRALRDTQRAENRVEKLLGRARILLNVPETEERPSRALNTPRSEKAGTGCGKRTGCKTPAGRSCKSPERRKTCSSIIGTCITWLGSPAAASGATNGPSIVSTRQNINLQNTKTMLTEDSQWYMERARELRDVILETGWDDSTWPELQDERVWADMERLRLRVEEAIISINEMVETCEQWSQAD